MHYDFEIIGPGKRFFYALLAELSGLAYSPQNEIEKKLVEIGYTGTDVLFFKTNLTAGFVISLPKVLVVVFRGSQTRREWLNNLNIYQSKTAFGRVHAGFRKTIDEIAPTLVPLIIETRGTEKHVVITGHSRGGALATLLMALLSANNCPAGVVTFGAPRAGDATFANNFLGADEKLPEWTKYIPGPIAYVMNVMGTIAFLSWWFVADYARITWSAARRKCGYPTE
jgi:Lipase (class 3)